MPGNTFNAAHFARLATQAWAEGEAQAYLLAFHEVHAQLRTMRNTTLLTQVVNTLLRRMERDKVPVLTAARAAMAELRTQSGKLMVMAAAVDVAFNNYKPGTEVARLRTPEEVLA
jgi:hypothetical protein